jgi:hypothetical protein
MKGPDGDAPVDRTALRVEVEADKTKIADVLRYECLRDPADQRVIKGFAYAMTNIARAATEKQMGVIVHGGGLDVDYAEMEEQANGYAVKRENGYSAIYHEPKALTL